MRIARRLLFVIVLLVVAGYSQTTYQKPPKEILDVLNAPPTPTGVLSPSQAQMILAQGVRYPAVAELAQPMLRLAGIRINPATNGLHLSPRFVGYTLKWLADGHEVKVAVPVDANMSAPRWSPDGKQFLFTNTSKTAVELWIGDAATGKIRPAKGLRLSAVTDDVAQWMPDSKTVLVKMVPADRGAAPAKAGAPVGPNVQESTGNAAPAPTYQDMLQNAYDEAQFDYYATAQLASVDSTTLKATPIGKPAIYLEVTPSPDGQHLLLERVHRPYSYLHPAEDFPKDVEVWDRTGKLQYTVAKLPLQDNVPIDGVATGPRRYAWRPNQAATLYWAEALDEGNPKKKVPHRDRLAMLKAPFSGAPIEIIKIENRLMNIAWGESAGVFVTDYERDKRWVRTMLVDPEKPASEPKLLWSRSNQDRYNDKGTPLTRPLANGFPAVVQDGDSIFLAGVGASQDGDRPFLDRFSVTTLELKRLFRSEAEGYEAVVALLSGDGTRFLTLKESLMTPPNYYVRTATEAKAVTNFSDPTPQIRQIKKQRVTYKREDGVQLSFTLYLPPNYKEGTRLPTIVWAYPLEYNDAGTAGQVSGSTQRFTTLVGISHLFLVLQGYAVLDNAAMPVIGAPETVNNTFVQQILADAKAAIDKAVEMGVTDSNRVGVGGHSYGAFMTANLLAHSDLFKAGVARSGAYNRTLTPFGFQSERRTFWEAKDTYLTMSPFLVADKIRTPILLIHGEADNNTGTFPIQSDRMYQAIRGNGGTVRYVTLPFESHGYSARESTEHTLWEMITWFDKWVKNAPEKTLATGK
ncbi:MAG TPA: prolyl oligopeptidase family serine peptidase [Clostridia bacterium]|nr:prolyl oligopeptidase family serine peptidase [Clostridia bacterium]